MSQDVLTTETNRRQLQQIIAGLSDGVILLEPDQTIDVVIRWDHRVTDAAMIAQTLRRLEQVLNTEIATELLADHSPAMVKTMRAAAF